MIRDNDFLTMCREAWPDCPDEEIEEYAVRFGALLRKILDAPEFVAAVKANVPPIPPATSYPITGTGPYINVNGGGMSSPNAAVVLSTSDYSAGDVTLLGGAALAGQTGAAITAGGKGGGNNGQAEVSAGSDSNPGGIGGSVYIVPGRGDTPGALYIYDGVSGASGSDRQALVNKFGAAIWGATPIADGTYALTGSVTVVNGIITAIG
jgi:hypothetical protein